MKFYTAYGSNMDLVQMQRRCENSKFVGTAKINGYRLAFKHSQSGAYSTIEKSDNHYVPAVVFEISDNDERCLDKYEGYPNFYHKDNMTVEMSDGGKCETMLYILREDAEFGVPSAIYYDILARAYCHFNFDFNILSEALHYSYEESYD